MAHWTIVFDIKLVRTVSGWSRRNQIELAAIQRLLATEGPDGLDWNANALTGATSWDRINSSYQRVYWTAFEERFYWIKLEILPGRTIRFHDAHCGVSRFWR